MLKSNAKKDASRMAKEAPTRGAGDHFHLGFWAWEGGRGKGKPFPEGLKADFHALNHLSPEGWWDFRILSLRLGNCEGAKLRESTFHGAVTPNEIQKTA